MTDTTLTPLATSADLTARNITLPDGLDVDTALASASASVRDAAGCPIIQATSTVVVVVDDPCWITLPAGPVSAVASVSMGDVAVTRWTKVGDSVRVSPRAWPVDTCFPAEVTITYTHGLPTVPADIVDLVCSVVAIIGAQNGDPGSGGKTTMLRLGDYTESFAIPIGTDSPSPAALPLSVRQALQARFGTSVAMVRI